jgi:hypothetical protein
LESQLSSIGIHIPGKASVDDSSVSSSPPSTPLRNHLSFEESLNIVSSPSASSSKSLWDKFLFYKTENKQQKSTKESAKKPTSFDTHIDPVSMNKPAPTTENHDGKLLANKKSALPAIGDTPLHKSSDKAFIPRAVIHYFLLICLGFFLLALSGFRSLQQDLEPNWLERNGEMTDSGKLTLHGANQVRVPPTSREDGNEKFFQPDENEACGDLSTSAIAHDQNSALLEQLIETEKISMDLSSMN